MGNSASHAWTVNGLMVGYMGRGGTKLAVLAIAAGLVAVSCSISTTRNNQSAEDAVGSAEDAVGPTTTPPPAADSTDSQPTPLAPAPTDEPTAQVVPQDPPQPVDPTLLQGVSPDGRYAFASVASPWNDPLSCDSAPEETLAGIDIEASQPADILLFNPGLVEAANVRQMDFSQGGRAAVLFSCGATEPDVWLKVVEFDSLGRVAIVGPRIDLASASSVDVPFLLGWTGEDSIRLDFFVRNDFGDQETWQFEEQLIAADSGAVLSAELSTYSNGSSRINRHGVTTPDGRFTYRQIEDPTGSTGCEGFGVAVTIEVDDGSERRIAFRDDSQVFSSVSSVQFGPDDLILWTSGCEGYISAHVGRIAPDGRIVGTFAMFHSSPREPGEHEVEFIEAMAQLAGIVFERRRSEDAIAAADQDLRQLNEEIGRLIQDVTHSLRSPLVALEGFVGLLRRDVESGRTDRLADFTRRITGAAQRIRGDIDGLMEIDRHLPSFRSRQPRNGDAGSDRSSEDAML